MITDSFANSKPLIEPEMFYPKAEVNEAFCIATFSKSTMEKMIEKYAMQKHSHALGIGGGIDVYRFTVNGKTLFAYQSPIGAAGCATFMDEIRALTGCRRFIQFGSCGALDQQRCKNRLIVPCESYRDEGVSYHYAPPADYITMTHHKALCAALDQLKVPYVCGRNWTIEVLYRETEEEVARRKADDCLSVEMEAAACQAMADYRQMEFYTFFFAGDSFDEESWSRADLGNDVEFDNQDRAFEIAIRVAEILGE